MERREYKYYLPKSDGANEEKVTHNNSVIIIGANGAGKSQLGAWMERHDPSQPHRIGAQRSLTFKKFIDQRSCEQAINLLLFGRETTNSNHDRRWEFDGEKFNYTSSLLNDYEYVLSALIALKNVQLERYIEECKKHEQENREHDPVPRTVVDQLQAIWDSVFPQRSIKIDDGKVTAIYKTNDNVKEYGGRDMSDGERVALYLIAQALCVPANKTIIIDEPEIHLHRSIINRLWNAIEVERQDCLFIYITHDTQFAAEHKQAKKIWVKSFNGSQWELEEIAKTDLPENLLLTILGNRKNVLFVEGSESSYDTRLYSELYNDYYVVPCGSCSQVIAMTKAMRGAEQLHHLSCYGIIDRDYRSEIEIAELKIKGVFTLGVAEVENLFIVEELLQFVNSFLGFNDSYRIDSVKHVVETGFQGNLDNQIRDAVIFELKYKLSRIPVSGKTREAIRNDLSELYVSDLFETVWNEKEKLFNQVSSNNNYGDVLKIYNSKHHAYQAGDFFGLQNKEYSELILRCLSNNYFQPIAKSLKKYLPPEIPSERLSMLQD